MILQLENLPDSAKDFLNKFPEGGVFGLQGPLGVGKTTWVKAVVKALSEQSKASMPRVVSPSFVIHQSYETKPRVEHFDFYRLELLTPESLIDVGYWEAVERAQSEKGYVFVEWPEKAKDQNLQLTSELYFQFGKESSKRLLEFRAPR